MFFSFDGIDGVGKSTQLSQFRDWLREQGHIVVECRDPGSTGLGEKLRQLVLTHDPSIPIDRTSEMLLYMAARAQLVVEVIQPSLAAGKIVVSDRYLLANLVYQAYAGGLDVETVRYVGQVATRSVMPNCVFLLDMSPEDAADRLNRELDRMERQGADYRRKLRDGFLTEAALDPTRIHIVDAAHSIEVVQGEIREIAADVLHHQQCE
jgi:dTMP kinase